MKILLVEDQLDKKENILNFIESIFSDFEVSDCSSLRGALREIVSNNNYDLILLDMSMPAFDPSESYMDDSPESYAGMELMEQMKLRSIKIPVIVVTQFSSFEGGSVALDGLSSSFVSKFRDFYYGHVYYNSANENWKSELEARIKSLNESK
ncbi:response regulator [Vibrio sp. 2026]|jgi:Response regulator containing CheY-like receiver, AAA-type ATPase, and DNA-binding domains|uniref:response regulator n=2 Tax=Vibrio TaxID=662 RepID=UPI001F97B0C8|nr:MULTISPECIES: response regulator [unclassified Vibrio]EJG0749104.1 response regulator [Vibrio parahaemolyticus]CAH0527968.1 hypothetical protein CTH30272_01617 [Catenococcus thiocycli]HDU8579816.1 response regulator [Vibrio diabolicus]MDG2626489.1 response regulator [Vibrio parahaemolyticus]MDW1513462.1 response regulator [Vibrio sp. Vb5035]